MFNSSYFIDIESKDENIIIWRIESLNKSRDILYVDIDKILFKDFVYKTLLKVKFKKGM